MYICCYELKLKDLMVTHKSCVTFNTDPHNK